MFYFFNETSNNDNISHSHTLNALVPYGYVVILLYVCTLLSLLLIAILFILSVYAVCRSLLNLSCVLSIFFFVKY